MRSRELLRCQVSDLDSPGAQSDPVPGAPSRAGQPGDEARDPGEHREMSAPSRVSRVMNTIAGVML